MSEKQAPLSTAKKALIGTIIFACLFDIFTFFYSGFRFDLFEYEINPLVVLWKAQLGLPIAIGITILIKLLINAGLVYLLYSYNPKKSHVLAYMLVYGIIFSILIQLVGAGFNLYTADVISNIPAGKVVPQPLSSNESLLISQVISIIYYCVILLNMLSFWVYERIYRKSI